MRRVDDFTKMYKQLNSFKCFLNSTFFTVSYYVFMFFSQVGECADALECRELASTEITVPVDVKLRVGFAIFMFKNFRSVVKAIYLLFQFFLKALRQPGTKYMQIKTG